MRKLWQAAMTVGLLATACARPPATSPDTDALVEWLMTSPTAQEIADAALSYGWFSDVPGPGKVGDLVAVMAATDTRGVKELDRALRPVAGQMHALLGALRHRRLGSTRGDRAHWAGVALLAFSEAEPDTEQIPATELWDVDYLGDIGELRAIAARGNLSNVARPLVLDPEPPPPDFTFKPLNWRTRVAARAERSGWLVFDTPEAASSAAKVFASGAVEFVQDEVVSSDDYVVQTKRPGRAQVRADYVQTVARYARDESGRLVFDARMNLAARADQTLTVMAHNEERRKLWVWLGDGKLAQVDEDCCYPTEGLDTLLWLRLANGLSKGKWMMAPTADFRPASRAEYVAGEVAAGRLSERAHAYPTMGLYGPRDNARPVVVGARLSIWRRGIAEGEPIFVVHGLPGLGSAYLREPLADALGKVRQLFFYDQRGSGYSEGGDDLDLLTMDQMVTDLDLLRQRADLEQIDLLAHGFGALVALRYATLYPQRVSRLILVEPEPASYGEWVAFLEEVDARRSPAERIDTERFERHVAALPEWGNTPGVMLGLLGLRTRPYTVDPAAADRIDFALTDYVLQNWAITREALRQDLGGWDLHDDLSAISMPTLIVAGDHGALAGAQRMHEGLPNSELIVLDNVGHYPFIEDPARFAQSVLDFLRR